MPAHARLRSAPAPADKRGQPAWPLPDPHPEPADPNWDGRRTVAPGERPGPGRAPLAWLPPAGRARRRGLGHQSPKHRHPERGHPDRWSVAPPAPRTIATMSSNPAATDDRFHTTWTSWERHPLPVGAQQRCQGCLALPAERCCQKIFGTDPHSAGHSPGHRGHETRCHLSFRAWVAGRQHSDVKAADFFLGQSHRRRPCRHWSGGHHQTSRPDADHANARERLDARPAVAQSHHAKRGIPTRVGYYDHP